MWFTESETLRDDSNGFEDHSLGGLTDFDFNRLEHDDSLELYDYAALYPDPRRQLLEFPSTSFNLLIDESSQPFSFNFEPPDLGPTFQQSPSSSSSSTSEASSPLGLVDDSSSSSESESENEEPESILNVPPSIPSLRPWKPRLSRSRREFITKETGYADISVTTDMVMAQWISQNPFYGERFVISPDGNIPFTAAIQYLFEEPSNNFPHFQGFKDTSAMFGDAGVSLNNKNAVVEQVIQFPEFENRTFELLGNSDFLKLQNFIPSPRRGVRITPEMLTELLLTDPSSCVLLDARFPYEFNASTIGSIASGNTAINIDKYWDPKQIYNTLWSGADTRVRPRYPGKKLIIFCEFSSLRGPGLYRNITLLDQAIRLNQFRVSTEASISYPEIYILQGGYRGFFDWTLSNMTSLEQENRVFIIISQPGIAPETAFVSEFSQPSEMFWQEKKDFFLTKGNINTLMSLGFPSLIDLWDPFTASSDSFPAFKREIDYARTKILEIFRERRSLPQSEYSPPSQRQRVGEDLE